MKFRSEPTQICTNAKSCLIALLQIGMLFLFMWVVVATGQYVERLIIIGSVEITDNIRLLP
jgi:hypothetical protein